MAPKGRKRAPKAEEGPKSLLDCWDAVRASEKRRRTSSDTCVTLWTFSKVLQQLGLECVRCGREHIERALDELAPDVPHDQGFTQAHLLLLVWAPVLKFARAATPFCRLSDELTTCWSLVAGGAAEVLGAPEVLEVDTLLSWMAAFLADFLGVLVDPLLLRAPVSALVPNVFECTRLTGVTLLASGALEACFGPALSALVQRKTICFVAKVHLEVPPGETLNDLISETLASRMPKEEAPPARDLAAARGKLAKTGFGTIVQSMVEVAVKTWQSLFTSPRPSLQCRGRLQLRRG